LQLPLLLQLQLQLPLLLPLQLPLLLPLPVLRRHPRAKRRIPVFALAVACPSLPVPKQASRKINFKTLSHFPHHKKRLLLDHVYHASHHEFTTHLPHQNPQTPPKPTTSPQQTFSRRKNRANPHPDRYHPGFPQQNPRFRRLYLENMSTSTNSPSITADEFQALEQKVLRAVEIVKREREARTAAEAEVASLREQLAAQQTAASANETELNTLHKEREAVRLRVEKMLQQMDELL
jgi:hypothetical protein